MLVIENIRETLIKTEKEITTVSQDIRKQFKIIETLISTQKYSDHRHKSPEQYEMDTIQESQEFN